MTKAEKRAIQLLEMLQVNKKLDVKTVSAALKISEATVRRMFSQLEEEGKVIRTHGGVQLAPLLGHDYSFRLSVQHRSREKIAIGNEAAKLVQDNDRIFLDSGTTVLRLAEALNVRIQTGELNNIVVLTNSLTHIETIAQICRVILIGGEIRAERRDVCGAIAEKALKMFHVDKAFFGADAISLKGGLMTTDERTARMNEIVITHAESTYVLEDSEKFDKKSFITYAELNTITAIYTDNKVRKDIIGRFAENKIDIVPVSF